MEQPRTTSERDHDDSFIIDAIEDAPAARGSYGGTLQRDVATENELSQVEAPEATTRVRKDTDIENDTSYRTNRARNT